MIEVKGLFKSFGSMTVVRDLSFEVAQGETLALIGPNGAGKTTTLKMLLGLVHPDRGRIALGRERLAPSVARARAPLGYVPQRVEFPPGRTATEVLCHFSDLRGLPRTAVQSALERVGLTSLAERTASDLSGGFTQRLSLAQALLGDPELLVLDEPTASLDPEATWEFRSLIEQLRRQGVTILLCSHLLAEVERVADRVLILVEGRQAAIESLDALRARQASATRLAVEIADPVAIGAAVRVLERAGVSVAKRESSRLVLDASNGRGLEAVDALRFDGVPIQALGVERPSLEELFLGVVRGAGRQPGAETERPS